MSTCTAKLRILTAKLNAIILEAKSVLKVMSSWSRWNTGILGSLINIEFIPFQGILPKIYIERSRWSSGILIQDWEWRPNRLKPLWWVNGATLACCGPYKGSRDDLRSPNSLEKGILFLECIRDHPTLCSNNLHQIGWENQDKNEIK